MKNILVYDIGGTSIKWAITTQELEIIERGSIPTFLDDTEEKSKNMIKRVVEHINEIKAIHEVSKVGVSTACVINMDTGEVIGDNPVFKGYVGVNIVKEIKEGTGLDSVAMNDGNSGVLGEYVKGPLKEVGTAVMVVLGTGIGSGILHEGKVFGGHNYWAGEVGTILVGDEPWEDKASVAKLCKRLSDKLGFEVDGKYIYANLDNEIVAKEYDDWLVLIAKGIKAIFHMFGPEYILIGGGVSANDTFKMEDIMTKLKPIVNEYVYNAIKLRKASLGNDANIYGVASLCRE